MTLFSFIGGSTMPVYINPHCCFYLFAWVVLALPVCKVCIYLKWDGKEMKFLYGNWLDVLKCNIVKYPQYFHTEKKVLFFYKTLIFRVLTVIIYIPLLQKSNQFWCNNHWLLLVIATQSTIVVWFKNNIQRFFHSRIHSNLHLSHRLPLLCKLY